MASYMLFAGSDPAARAAVEEASAKLGYACRIAAGGSGPNTGPGANAGAGAAADQAEAGRPAFMVLDLDIAGAEPLALLRRMQEADAAPVIVLASPHADTLAKQALREGASDYLVKPLTAERVGAAMRNALKISVLEEEISRLKRHTEGKLAWSDIIAVSPEMQRVLSLAKRAADLDIPVLIEGESGTGRELIARAIHAASSRAGARFVAVDLREYAGSGRSAPSDTLLEALWSEAEGGTVFIQEVGALGERDQERLAHLLARRGKAGEEAQPKDAHAKDAHAKGGQVRLICSSSADLIEQVKNRRFREDIFYLINVFPIWIPPLRDRPDDLGHLVWHYLARFAAEEGKRIQSVDADAMALLKAYGWPGNVRQLENAVYRAVILAEGDQLRADDLPQIAAHIAAQMRGVPGQSPATGSTRQPYRGPAMLGSPLTIATPTPYLPPSAPVGIPALTEEGEIRRLNEIEADLIRLALGHYRGHITEAARRLGIGRSTLYRKMREFGLDMRHNSV